MSKKLFVGNLPFSMTEDQLHTMFTAIGKVTSAKLITDKYSGQSRGFSFVEMEDDTEAAAAIAKLNGTSVDGRQLVVNEARPPKERSEYSGSSRGGNGGGNRGYKKW